MRPILIRIAAHGSLLGSVTREAWPCGVPGLAVIDGVPPMCTEPSWTVVHVRSGSAVWRCIPSPEGALAYAELVADLADWTLSAPELVKDPLLRDDLESLGVHAHRVSKWRGADLNNGVII